MICPVESFRAFAIHYLQLGGCLVTRQKMAKMNGEPLPTVPYLHEKRSTCMFLIVPQPNQGKYRSSLNHCFVQYTDIILDQYGRANAQQIHSLVYSLGQVRTIKSWFDGIMHGKCGIGVRVGQTNLLLQYDTVQDRLRRCLTRSLIDGFIFEMCNFFTLGWVT